MEKSTGATHGHNFADLFNVQFNVPSLPPSIKRKEVTVKGQGDGQRRSLHRKEALRRRLIEFKIEYRQQLLDKGIGPKEIERLVAQATEKDDL